MGNELDNEYVDHPMELVLQVKYALHAAKGMRHLHRIHRMHRDLKCDNLLINVNGIVKVADLGCTKIAPKIDDNPVRTFEVRAPWVRHFSGLPKYFAARLTTARSTSTATEIRCGKSSQLRFRISKNSIEE